MLGESELEALVVIRLGGILAREQIYLLDDD